MSATLIQPNMRTSPDRSLQLAQAAAREAEDNRGQNVVVLDMRSETSIFDYFVVVTGTSTAMNSRKSSWAAEASEKGRHTQSPKLAPAAPSPSRV